MFSLRVGIMGKKVSYTATSFTENTEIYVYRP